MSTRKSTPLQVRLGNDLHAELADMASRLGCSKVDIVKLCIASMLDYIEKTGMKSLPDDWAKAIKDMDGRTHRYTRGERIYIGAINGHTNHVHQIVAEKGGKYSGRGKPRGSKKGGGT